MNFENNSRDEIFNLNRGNNNNIKNFGNNTVSNLRVGDDVIFNKKKISDDIISSSSASSANSVSSVSDTSSDGSASVASLKKKRKNVKNDSSSESGESASSNDSASSAGSANSGETNSTVSGNNVIKKKSSRTSSIKEKKEIIYQIDRLEQRGYKIPFKFNLNSDLEEMRLEYNKIIKEKELDNSVRFSRKMLMAFVTAGEYLNNRYDPMAIQLEGWSDQVHDNITEYDDIFEELHEKYKSTGKKMPPELRLFISLSGSAFMFHLTNRMFKEQKLPDVENVLKSNPELMKQFQQAAAKEYILPQHNRKDINNFSGNNNNNNNNNGSGILGMVSGLFNNIGNGSMRSNMNQNYKNTRDDDSDSISEIDSIIDNVHKNITINKNNNNIETLSVSDEELTSIIEDEADLQIIRGKKKNNQRSLHI
tara:strand:- start:8535 stop:9800 length:1266 start_codon:yes stop_codon:yes gene_type:complete